MKMHNKRHTKLRVTALVASVAAVGGLAAMATGATGAYFSDTHSGTVSGSIGTVKVATAGGGGAQGLDLAFVNLLPGTPQTVSAAYGNGGNVPEDIYLTFPNATALSALNNLGMYGTLHISSDGSGAVGDVFDSDNLDDSSQSCGPFNQGTSVINGVTQPNCWPLPAQLLIASNVQPGQTGNFHFTFNYASKLGGSVSNGGGLFNTYPVAPVADPSGHNGQVTIVPSDGSGSGLPYDVVATQVGITPGAPGTKP